MVLLAAEFWAGSRYPALNQKLAMGTDTPVAGLAFSTLVSIAPDEKIVPRILYETVNWTYTNRQGMTFGVLFGALLMTLLGLFERRSVRSGFGNTVLGVAIGTPLGVCVNCAAPIAKSIHAAGGRVETMLAAMFSSPTLNVIVLTMLFGLFPMYMAAIKVGLTVAFILVGVPLLARFLYTPNGLPGTADLRASRVNAAWPTGTSTPIRQDTTQPDIVESWAKGARWVVQTLAANLWFIVKTTVPLMLLAGFLGSVLITILPLDSLTDVLPKEGRQTILLAMAGLALFGILLPVPMTFDVIVTAVLWQAGLPVHYVMVLLFTLGIFSIFPFFIVWRSIGLRTATILLVGLAGLGMVAGVIGHQYFQWDSQRQQRLFFEVFSESAASLQGPKVMRIGAGAREEAPDRELVSSLSRTALGPQRWLAVGEGISVERIPFQAPSGRQAGKPFTRLEGSQVGIDEPYSFSALTFFHPRVAFRGVASGDVHNDGWMDVLLTSDSGLSLYANRGGGGFVLQRMEIPALRDFFVVNAALVDLNNDGWLDIFFSTYRQGNYVIYNTEGRFTAANLRRLPSYGEPVMSGAAAFGDVDKDGNLDIVLGSWIHPCSAFLPCEDRQSNNFLLRNVGGKFQVEQPLPRVPGRQTLSLLLSDINNDGNLDLIIGNEDPAPDFYYFGNGNGAFRQVTRDEGVIPHSTSSTMSVASADVDNDLRPEVYLGQITAFSEKQKGKSRDVGPEACEEILHPVHRKGCQDIVKVHQGMPGQTKNRDVFKCLSTEAGEFREDCIAYSMLLSAIQTGPEKLCEQFPGRWEAFGFICRLAYQEAPNVKGEDSRRSRMYGPHRDGWAQSIPVVGQKNVLLAPSGNGRFVDKAGAMGVQIAGFTWNAKFADLDNDEFVDLYAVNGWFPERSLQSHIFYQNERGKRFVDKTEDAGLVSFLPTSAYTYVDLDNDGDLDIVAVPVVGPVLVYMNNSKRNRIAFELRDHVGNRSGIGSRIIVHYGPDGARHQVREILASGGFISFDAPVAYFGLGEFERVERIEVHWSTGERSEIPAAFRAGARYVVNREGSVKPNKAASVEIPARSVPGTASLRTYSAH